MFGTAQYYIRPLARRPLLIDGNQDPFEDLLALFSVRHLHTLGLTVKPIIHGGLTGMQLHLFITTWTKVL